MLFCVAVTERSGRKTRFLAQQALPGQALVLAINEAEAAELHVKAAEIEWFIDPKFMMDRDFCLEVRQ